MPITTQSRFDAFAHNITYLRTQRRMTQEQIADAIGVKLKRYQAWEEGRCLPRMKLMVKVCAYFDCHDVFKFVNEKVI